MRHQVQRHSAVSDALQIVLVPAALLLGWEYAVSTGLWPRTLVASPLEVARAWFGMIANGQLVHHVIVSFARLVAGFVIGFAMALALGSIVGLSRLAERVIAPTVQLLAPIPVVAWIPFLFILFSIDGTKIAIIAFGTFFPVFFSVVQGIRGADKRLVEIGYMFQKTDSEILFGILLPAALPVVLTASRMALGLSWVLLLTSEIIASSAGLGWLIWDSRSFSRPDDMIVGMIAVGLLGAATDRAMAILQTRLLRWQSSFAGH